MAMKRGETLTSWDENGIQWATRRRRCGQAVPCEAGCGELVEPGDDYVDVRGFEDGRADLVRIHLGCWEEMYRLLDDSGEELFYCHIAEYARYAGRVFDPATKTWGDAP